VSAALRRAVSFVRINPIHQETGAEVETVLAGGARVIMLPYFRTPQEVETFVRCVDSRAQVTILLETGSALARVREVLAVAGIDEVMAGLNDLRIELRVGNVFEVLASPLLDCLAGETHKRGLQFSVGGIARLDDTTLPVPADLVLAQYPRLGATGAWLSRSFLHAPTATSDPGAAIRSIRRRLSEWDAVSPEAREAARDCLAARAREVDRGNNPQSALSLWAAR